MWKVLASKYYNDKSKTKSIEFGAIKDVEGDVARSLGLNVDAAGAKSKVAVWKRGDEAVPTLYDGTSQCTLCGRTNEALSLADRRYSQVRATVNYARRAVRGGFGLTSERGTIVSRLFVAFVQVHLIIISLWANSA